MATNILVRAKILKVNTRFHAGFDVQPVTPRSFSPKIIYVSKRLCPINLSSLFLWCPVLNRETKFVFAIKALVILSVLYWQTKVINKLSCCIMKFKFNQMMHFYKFYTFYRDQSLETE